VRTAAQRLALPAQNVAPPTSRVKNSAANPVPDWPKPPAEVKPIAISGGGERRHLTVLFCDLVGSTETAAQLDPEEWRDVVASYRLGATEAITRFGGYIAHYAGDGIMALFGYPEAHDNDPERAVRSGLGVLNAIAKLNEQAKGPELTVRVGIDSGAVVIGKGADVFGEAPNIAARTQAAAQPGTVLITDATHRLISGLFFVEECGPQMLKGIERPIRLYRVIQPTGVRGRLEAAAAARGLTPFVGREDELRLLMNRWEQAIEGEGQAVIIIGEAGIGKSRLLQHFHQQIASIPHTWAETAATPIFQSTPFHPVTELLREFLAAHPDEPSDGQLARLEPALELVGMKPAEAIPLIAPLLNLRVPHKYPPLLLLPEQQRRRLLATLIEWVRGVAKLQPLIIAAEDLHWADPSTLEVLELLLEQGATTSLLLLYTGRPEFRPQWPLRAHHLLITLSRLNSRNVRTMVGQVAAHKALSEETVAVVVQRTGGVPLFVEELTRALLESGNGRLTAREIPVTLHDSLMTRLDQLGPAKGVLQIAAVIGSEFSYELLHAVHPFAEEELQRALHNLIDAELIYVRGIAPDATYIFKHALIRDAAYEALLRSRRKELHRLVAATIAEKFNALKQAHPEILAHHWTQAGETELAISEWTRAARAAETRGAFNEALGSYNEALNLVRHLSESAERDARELQLRGMVYLMLWMTRGPSAPDTTKAGELITFLAEKSGNLALVAGLMVSTGMSSLLTSRDIGGVVMLADQALELATHEGSPRTLLLAHSLQMQVGVFRGDLIRTEEHFVAEMKIADDLSKRREYSLILVQDFATAALNAWLQGQSDLARRRLAEMLAITNANNPYEAALSQIFAAYFYFFLREYEQSETFATRALELSEKHQFPLAIAASKCVIGNARAQLGRAAEGVELIRQGIAGALEIGLRPRVLFGKIWLALAQAAACRIPEALETVEQALEENAGLPVFLPQPYKLRGELRIRQGLSRPAELDLRESLARARSMGAKAYELRATMSLARLLASQSRRHEARTMLAEIYNWFTEGFDTADLKEARALLHELTA
jgi:class 3 adenylate cyclase/tetratricopeptide (TPR) repeat protein